MAATPKARNDSSPQCEVLPIAGALGAEIAEAMGRSHEAVRALQHRAIKRLRTILQPVGKDLTHDQ